jgi:hypothetical protein
LRGRDGALVLDSDPTMDIAMKNIFANPTKGHTAEFVERLWYTPPESRNDLHNRTLEIL